MELPQPPETVIGQYLVSFSGRSIYATGNVTHQECLLLLRVLDKMKLPVACRASSTSETVSVPTQKTVSVPTQKTAVNPAGNDGAIGGLVRRLTGAASEALNLAPVKRGVRYYRGGCHNTSHAAG